MPRGHGGVALNQKRWTPRARGREGRGAGSPGSPQTSSGPARPPGPSRARQGARTSLEQSALSRAGSGPGARAPGEGTPTLVVQPLQAGQVAQHRHAVAVGVGPAARVLGQPQHAQVRQALQVAQLGQAGDAVAPQVQLAQLPAPAHGLQGRHAVDTAETRGHLSAPRHGAGKPRHGVCASTWLPAQPFRLGPGLGGQHGHPQGDRGRHKGRTGRPAV